MAFVVWIGLFHAVGFSHGIGSLLERNGNPFWSSERLVCGIGRPSRISNFTFAQGGHATPGMGFIPSGQRIQNPRLPLVAFCTPSWPSAPNFHYLNPIT
jgi:hypothetical protein